MLSGMETRRWTNPGLPQTLQIAMFLFYFDAALTALFGGLFVVLGIVFIVAEVAAGFGLANEKRWGYVLGIAASAVLLVLSLGSPIAVLIGVARLALLLHPQSREYQRIWFK